MKRGFTAEAAMAHFRARIERNKTRRRRDGDPPAAMPATVDPRPRGGGFSGGAAAVMTFEDEGSDSY
jgi:hypothetical protein